MTDDKHNSKSNSKIGWDPNFDERMGITPRKTDENPDKRTTVEIEAAQVEDEDTAPVGEDTLIVRDKTDQELLERASEAEQTGGKEDSERSKMVTKHLKRDTDDDDPVHGLGAARFDGLLEIEVRETDIRFAFPYNDFTEIALGRRDTKTGITPEVDLTPYGGGEKGVSRQHAVIVREQASLYLVDQKSVNGTFLNGQELMPENPRMLRDGDDIKLGDLVLRVHFRSKRAMAQAEMG